MTWIPLVFGSMGAFGGGYLSDRLSRHRGVTGRLIVLIVCCVSYCSGILFYALFAIVISVSSCTLWF